METANLLGAERENANIEHPFLETKSVGKESLVSSSSYKKTMFVLVSFIITIFVGFLVGSVVSPDAKQNNIESPLSPTLSTESALTFSQMTQSTLTPTANPTVKPTNKPTKAPTNKPTKPPTNKPTESPTNKATTSTTAKSTTATTTSTTSTSSTTVTTRAPSANPTKHNTTISPTHAPSASTTTKPLDIVPLKGTMNENVLFQSQTLSTDLEPTELFNLEMNIDIITVNEDEGFLIQNTETFYGPYHFNYKYPAQETGQYETNEIRRTCYHFKLKGGSTIKNAVIVIEFNRFQLENGFDRVLIRHFNSSFIDVPLSYTGYESDLSIQYLLEKEMTKSVCIEFQSDETITNHGIDYDVKLYYDLCAWSDWTPCYAMDLRGKRWTRGPFMNGKCGLGITSKHRLETDTKQKTSHSEFDGFLSECLDEDIMDEYGPEYCVKATCGDYDNYKDPDFDATKVPGQGWYNISRYYNGAGRLDPHYADPFRIYLSTENNINIKSDEWFERLREKLALKAKEIADEHQSVNILEYAVLDAKHRDATGEYLGAKVLDSLINGKPFIAALTGDSVTSGHDNMFMSTYPMQLQSRLRQWWLQNGNRGAAFFTRNYGVGGGPASDSQGFMPMAMVTETFPDSFSKLSDILHDNYDIWYRNGGYPIHKIDLETFEYHFTEGRGTQSSRELHLREAAYLGAVWAVIQPVVGVTNEYQSCRSWSHLNRTMMSDWKWWQRDLKYEFVTPYLNKMGIAALDPNWGMPASCPLYKEGSLRPRANSNNEDDGLRPDGQMYAYTPWWLKVNWHPNSRGHRVMSDVISYWMIHSAIKFLDKYKTEIDGLQSNSEELKAFFENKSGNWKSAILKSIMDKQYDEFVEAKYCGVRNKEKAEELMKTFGSKAIKTMQYHDYCESVPFALTNVRPTIYNTHNLLTQYFYTQNDTVHDWNAHMNKAGWHWKKSDNIVSIDRKLGTEGNMDIFSMLKPNSELFHSERHEFESKNNINGSVDVDRFHQYLIEKNKKLQFVVKTPKFGSGAIKAFNGFNCDKDLIHKVHVYVKKLSDDEDDDDLGQLIKGDDCILSGLQLNTKYIVTYVPYNTGSELYKYFIMFLVAY